MSLLRCISLLFSVGRGESESWRSGGAALRTQNEHSGEIAAGEYSMIRVSDGEHV